MEQQRELHKILEQLETNSRKQLLHARLQTLFTVLCALCCGVLVMKVIQFIPQVESLLMQAETLLADLSAVTKELAKLELGPMIENINALVTTSQSGVEDALSKLNEIDFKTLNQAVKDLSDVVKPLADFVNRLSRGGLL